MAKKQRLSDVALVNMGKGMYARRPKDISGRKKRGGRKPRYDRSKDEG